MPPSVRGDTLGPPRRPLRSARPSCLRLPGRRLRVSSPPALLSLGSSSAPFLPLCSGGDRAGAVQGRGRSLRFQDWPQDERGEWESLCGGSRSQKDVSGPRSGPAAFGKSSWESDEGDVSGWEQDTPGVGRENRGLTGSLHRHSFHLRGFLSCSSLLFLFST